MSARSDHLEIEHKFLVGPDFDLGAFRRAAESLRPTRVSEVHVEDTYYLTGLGPHLIFRHRYDAERQELTLKDRGPGDTEVRLEVNLRLDQRAGNQRDTVTAFLQPLSITWQGSLIKDIVVFYYPACEVVYYTARTKRRSACCVEFEATGHGHGDVGAARTVLLSYEQDLGFAGRQREKRSLFDLLLQPDMNVAP